MPPPEVSPFSGPCNRAKRNPPPLVFDFTSPVKSSTSIPPPAVSNFALNFAGTVIVYFASFEFLPLQDQLFLVLLCELIVTVSPSCEKFTGLSFRNFSSADLLLRLTLRQTSTTTSVVALVPTTIPPKSTSTTTVPPGFTLNFSLICSSVAPRAERDASGKRIEPQNATNSAELINRSLFIILDSPLQNPKSDWKVSLNLLSGRLTVASQLRTAKKRKGFGNLEGLRRAEYSVSVNLASPPRYVGLWDTSQITVVQRNWLPPNAVAAVGNILRFPRCRE